ATVTYEGLTYRNNEAAFQAQKTFSDDFRTTFTTLAPSEAKRKGRRVRLRQDWEQVKDGIMEEIVRAKFTQNPELRKQLLATGNADLIEGNHWNDRYWGVDARTGAGENHLGKILMKIREELLKTQASPES
ncbi:MAG: NADAR family protein, partial [Eubacteriales bacterium]|nr:NADAR family protein [Eubacteriales bacterium]